jgi:predicted regulator of Ras-like GTPase activity (Roadblock/LC7/MglB family)
MMSVLTDNVKMKFAGFLRGLLRRVDDGNNVEPRTPRPVAAAPPPVVAAPPSPPIPLPAVAASPAEIASDVEMPLLPILEKLPMELRSKMSVSGLDLSQASMTIPVEKILPQLALGAVKISFGELRHAAPELFRVGEEYDSLPVALSLNEVLARLSPALLARNPAQKAVEVPAEISGPFGARAQGVSFATSLLKSTPPPMPPKTAPERVPLRVQPPVEPLKMAPPAAPRAPTAPAAAPIAPRASAPIQMPVQTPIPFSKPIVSAVPPTISTEPATILVPLAALSENWPESLRLEIAQSNLQNAQVALPVHLIEPALKRGRVIFSWHHVRSWIRPTPPPVSIRDTLELELPLKALAPLFLSRQKAAAQPHMKVALPPSSVPNLFFGFPQPQPEELAAPLNALPVVPFVKPVDAKLAETNYYVWGDETDKPRTDETDYKRPIAPATDFSSRRAMPAEIVERAMQLPGVAGALIALPDGLKVASKVPPDLNDETLAAFLPQLFSRVGQCSKELRMGELNNLNFTLGHVPWKIFRVNSIYFAAFGHAGEPLPTAQLALLAAELGKK